MATLRVPDVVPLPSEDCETLNNALEGLQHMNTCVFGTDEKGIIAWVFGADVKGIIWVLGRRNASQRREIRETYEQIYSESLIDRLHFELSGDFKKAVILWMYEPSERDARLANEALKSRKKSITRLQVIVEIACATSPHHLMAVRAAYCSLFDCSLEEDIRSHVPEAIRKVLEGLVRSFRSGKELVDLDIANSEATKLHGAIKSLHRDLDDVVMILSTRTIFQLKATFECYQQRYRNSIYQDIKSCGKGILQSVLGVVIWCIDSPEKHFAELIKASVGGIGTDENSLTRAIVTRAEIDMIKVRGEYFNMNKTSLDSAVFDNTSGAYRKFLMTLLGAKI
ncbi:Annexin like [Actinidia chinensis var. chinensis]|uniref:Annexin n=1 Tax=Actinidia chinensis var. chinensis TaxID=1590841 RepID=A0A2R6RA44_ACTCC|nr:Annexin like [Actinidia chinensis var. chinensis]